jgi:hypothetical protein
MLSVGANLKFRAADSCGAFKLFANVATILTDAFWFSAVR